MFRYFLILLFAVTISVSFAISEYVGMFLSIQPSSINRALGENTGVVNIWSSSPLVSYANPALPALHKGLSYGLTHEHYLEGYGMGNILYDVGIMTLSGSGIGLTLPAPNYSSDVGFNLSYPPMMYRTDNRYGYDSFDHTQIYGISLNACELLRNRLPEQSLLRDMDIAIGLNKLYIEEHRPAVTENGFYGAYNKAVLHNLGFITRYGNKLGKGMDFDIAVGVSLLNFDKAKMRFYPDQPMYPIYRYYNYGAAVSASLPNDGQLTGYPLSGWIPVHNLASGRLLFSYLDRLNWEEPIPSCGAEIGLLDVLFLRVGYRKDASGDFEGITYGFGGRLSFRDIITYNFNYSAMDGGDLVDYIKSSDHNVSFNIVEISKLLNR